MVTKGDRRDVGALMREGSVVDAAVARARTEAVRRHRMFGVPLVVWRDGHVVEIPADEIRLDEADERDA